VSASLTAAAIFAGGRARRLGGACKPLLPVAGPRIIDRQLDVLRPLFQAIVVVTADRAAWSGVDVELGVEVITDRRGPGLGPLGGLDAALAWLPTDAPAIVCVAGDMPFLSAAVLRRLRDAPPAAAVVPRLAGRPEPLCARYDRRLGEVVAEALDAGTRALHVFLDRVAVSWIEEDELRALDPTLRSFTHVNTPGDLSALSS
jgi:molybdopterin-guanine dinucleotide biosynthesis protein A